MIVRALCAAVLLTLCPFPAVAQSAAVDLPREIFSSEITPEQHEATNRATTAINRLIVAEAMAQLETGGGLVLPGSLPVPTWLNDEILEIVLASPAAWEDPARRRTDQAAIDGLLVWSMEAGHLSYHEWACRTGRESTVFVENLVEVRRIFTDYVERLMTRNFYQFREAMGYGVLRECSMSDLRRSRSNLARYSQLVSRL